MTPTTYTFDGFYQWHSSGTGIRLFGTYDDLNRLNNFIRDRDGREAGQFGAFGLDQLAELYPVVAAGVRGSKSFPGDSINLYVDDEKAFVAFAQPSGDRAVVWWCWRTESARNQFEIGPGAACLRDLALRGIGAHKDSCKLHYPEQGETAFMWKAPSVHPLQGLETAYQRIVHEAGRSPGSDPRQAEADALARFFQQDLGLPAAFTFKPDEPTGSTGLSSVRMNHLIDTFYLFRLLVQYRVTSDQPISEDVRVDLSGNLTKLLHNNPRMVWLSAWLTAKIADLGRRINALNGRGERRVIFFLKGGRALNYFLGTPEKGENDWDTQVVINPGLSAADWYQCFSEVHDVLLASLRVFQTEFTALVNANAAAFTSYLDFLRSQSEIAAADDEEVDEYEVSDVSGDEHANCKAELIDIGIPRRDSPAGLEEWTRLSENHALLSSNGVIYPHREYYLNEYLMMIREAFLPNVDTRKAPKRITRFGLALHQSNEVSPSGTDARRLATLPLTKARIDGLQRADRKDLFGLMMAQFAQAYNLQNDSGLAALFDAQAAALLANPPTLPTALAGVLDDAQKLIATDVGVAHRLSEMMAYHFMARNQFFIDNSKFFASLLRDLSQTVNQQLHGVAQFAICGSYAARLHAGHLRVPGLSGLEPVRWILVKLHSPSGSNETEVLNRVRDTITTVVNGRLRVSDGRSRHPSLYLYWPEKIKIADLEYNPLVLKIRGAAQTGSQLPILASIDGLAALDLRYLVKDYIRKTSKIDEYGSRRTLTAATGAITQMLSQFDFDSDEDEDEE